MHEYVAKSLITDFESHRTFLFRTMEGVLEGRVSVQQGNCIKGLSEEVRGSIRAQTDSVILVLDHMRLNARNQIVSTNDGGDSAEDGAGSVPQIRNGAGGDH